MDRRLNHIDVTWSDPLAYVVGLIATDGNLSSDGRHINLTSKDLEIVQHAKEILALTNTIGKKARGGSTEKKYYVLQFGSKNFYSFLLEIGLTPAKSKTLRSLKIPDAHFSAFLRGCIDGDGSINTFTHPESKLPQLRVSLASASPLFLEWMLESGRRLYPLSGGWISKAVKSCYMLRFGKQDSIQILRKMYAPGEKYFLQRKWLVGKLYLGE